MVLNADDVNYASMQVAVLLSVLVFAMLKNKEESWQKPQECL